MAGVNWAVAAQKRVEGEWTKVQTLAEIGAEVKPRKYSQEGADEINAFSVMRQAKMSRESVKALVHRAQDHADENELRDEIILDALGSADPDLFKQAPLLRLFLKYGIAAWRDNSNASGKPDNDWINGILESPDIAAEVVTIVKEFNRPLPKATSASSGTPSSGNSKE